VEINFFGQNAASSAVRAQVPAWTKAHPIGVGALPVSARKLSVLSYGPAAGITVDRLLVSPITPVSREKSALFASATRGVDQVPAPQQTEVNQCTTSTNGTTSGVPPRGRPV
jgi:hypothetical protein